MEISSLSKVRARAVGCASNTALSGRDSSAFASAEVVLPLCPRFHAATTAPPNQAATLLQLDGSSQGLASSWSTASAMTAPLTQQFRSSPSLPSFLCWTVLVS